MSNDTVEGAVVEDKVVAETPKEVVVELSPIEAQASEQGWVPKDEWVAEGNDPNEWRPAKEFVDRGELYKTIHTTRRELKQAQAGLSALQKHHQYVFEKAHRQAIADLRLERRAAIRSDDLERAEQIEDQIDEITDKHEQEKQVLQQEVVSAQQTGPHPEYQAWVDKNAWYLSEPELQEFADVTGIVFAKKNPNAAPATVLRHIEDKVRKQFPDKFGVRRAAPSPTVGSDRTVRKTAAKDDVDLDANEQAIMQDLIRNKVMTEAQYKAEIKKMRGK